MRIPLSSLATLLALPALLACGDGHDHDDHDHDGEDQFICEGDEDSFDPGTERLGEEGLLALVIVSADPPQHYVQNNTLVVRLEDSSGTPLDDADFVSVRPFTAKHDHGTPIEDPGLPDGEPGGVQRHRHQLRPPRTVAAHLRDRSRRQRRHRRVRLLHHRPPRRPGRRRLSGQREILGAEGALKWVMERLHDSVTADYVANAAGLLFLLLLLTVVWRRPRIRLAVALLSGAALTALTALVTSTGHSGMLIRTRYGLPHYLAYRNQDPVSLASVDPITVIPSYMLANLAFWCGLALLFAALTSPYRRRVAPLTAS